MNNLFLTIIKYEKTAEEGKIEKISEQYLVDALSFTEAEANITQQMKPFISGEFMVAAINRKRYNEIVSENWSINKIDAEANKLLGINGSQSTQADKWFECKLNFITLDEVKGKEKKTPVLILVHANSVNSAHDTLIQHMKGSMADYEIEKVAETKIIDVFMYEPQTDK
jgi:Domain of unknown function (DUF4494)